MIKSAHYYWIQCDNCGETCPQHGDEFSAWADEDQAIDVALASDWLMEDEHLCPGCIGVEDEEDVQA